MTQQQKKTVLRLRHAIVVLAALLALSGALLAGRYIHRAHSGAQTAATVQGNVIGQQAEGEAQAGSRSAAARRHGQPQPADAKVIELYQGHAEDNEKFSVGNMFPGDCETRYFCIKVYHDGPVELVFQPEVTGQTKSLAEALNVRVTRLETDALLCDAPFAEADGTEYSEVLPRADGKETVAYYQVEVSADTSMGNEYQQASLEADFHWYVKTQQKPGEETGGETGSETGGEGAQSGAATGKTQPAAPAATGTLTRIPQTGDPANLLLWGVLAVGALLGLAVLAGHRNKETKQNG